LGLAALGIGGAGLFGMGPLSQLASSSLGTTLAGLKSSPLITGASKFFGGEKTLGKTAAMFGLGGLGAAALQAAGLDTENPNEMPRDVESLKGYLRSGYLKLNPGARPEDVDAFVEANTREYAANGGRIGYADGTSFQRKALEKKGYSDTMQNMTPKEISQLYDSVMGTFSRRFQAYGGRIGYNEGTDFQKWLEGKQKFEQGQNAEQLYREYLEDKRRQKIAEQKTMAANGGRIGFFKGAQADARAGRGAMSPGTSMSGGFRGGGDGGNNSKSDRDDNREQYRAQGQYSRPPSTPSGGGGMDASRAQFRPQFKPQFGPQFGPQFQPQLFNSQGLGDTQFAKLIGPALIQYRILQKKQAMEPLGGDPFTPQDQNMLDKLNQMEEEEKIYSFPITAANGGRIGYAFGDVVNQASRIMGLPQRVNQAGVKELDLRDSGGFIPPVGVKEKADDIPAMLSNNEFVFTAESVRNMGNGDVNKGAQRMYDMMKYLEKGGIV
jgi:hypothetical protein